MAWQLTDDRPIYLQLMEQVKMKIIAGEYLPGSRIPGVRDLAAEASVNPNTMQKALSTLEEEKLVYSQRTAGRFITEDVEKIKQVKEEFATEQIREFLNTMQGMGLTPQETVTLLEKIAKEYSIEEE